MGILLGLLALGFVLFHVDWENLASVLASADYRFLIPFLTLYLLGLATRAQRWRLLLSGELPLRRAFHIMNIAYLVNGLLPMRLGELGRIVLAARANKALPRLGIASSILAERLLDVLAVAVMGLIAIGLAPVDIELRGSSLMGAALALFGFAALVVMASRRRAAERIIQGLTSRITWLRRIGLDRYARDFLAGLAPIAQRGLCLRALLWTSASWTLSVLTNYALMLAFFERGDWLAIMLSIATASFAIAVPIVPANIGAYEAAIIVAFAALGYERSDNLIAYALAVHALNILVNAITGMLGLISEGVTLSQLRADLEPPPPASR